MLSDVQKLLSGHPWQDKIQYFSSIDSTNTYAKKLALEGAVEGTVILAGQQTGGRGRLGRSFSSPAGMGLYLSLILRPDCPPQQLMHLTCAAGVAAAMAVAKFSGKNPGIKWTNDLVLGKRKLGGILTELSVDPVSKKVAWAVVGIGINCCQTSTDFPEEIRQIACSLGLQQQAVAGLTAELIRGLFEMRCGLFTEKEALMDAFRGRCVTIGQEISILRGDQISHAKALGVDDDGGLEVVLDNGEKTTVTSGEVSIRGMYGYL